MTDYINLSPAARFESLETIAREYFGPKWKAQFAKMYGIGPTTISLWGRSGCPVWPCLAMDAELYRKRHSETMRALRDIQARWKEIDSTRID